MKVLILFPRLDVPFKNLGPISSIRGPIPPIRKHWQNFFDGVKAWHAQQGDIVLVKEDALWAFTPDETDAIINQSGVDLVYIPHREKHSFPIKGNCKVLYYMQTVFPWRFYVDPIGFAGGSALYNMNIEDGMSDSVWYDFLKGYLQNGNSKFDQPQSGKWKFSGEYFLYTCQIPHDQTIIYHSTINVETALETTLKAAKETNKIVIVKGHPVNPSSMDKLRHITQQNSGIWLRDDVSIHDAIEGSSGVITVNSGTGMEALLHGKPVATFGRAEYDVVTFKAGETDIRKFMNQPSQYFDEKRVRMFIDKWCTSTYDTTSVVVAPPHRWSVE